MLGKRLTELRRKAGISQKELGGYLGVSHYTISAYEKERSEPSDELKAAMCKYFNVSSDYLLGLIDVPMPISRNETSIKIPEALTPTQQKVLQAFIQELYFPTNAAGRFRSF